MIKMSKAHLKRLNVAVDPVTVVIKECISLSTAMRKYSKIASQSGVAALLAGGSDIFSNQDDTLTHTFHSLSTHKSSDPLLSGFIQLRLMLNKLSTLDDIDSLTLLQPFLLIVSTSSVSGYITSLAIDSLQKFFNFNIINESSKNFVVAHRETINALTHCRFETSEQVSDDTVLLKVVLLLNSIINSSYGDYLSNPIMYDVIQTIMSLACNKKRTEVLRKAAEATMVSITLKVVEKVRKAEPTTISEQYINDESYSKDNLKDDTIGTTSKRSTARKGKDNMNADSVDSLPLPIDSTRDSHKALDSGNDKVDDDIKNTTVNDNTLKQDENGNVRENVKNDRSSLSGTSNQHIQHVKDNIDVLEENYGLPVAKQYLTLLLSLIMPENQAKHTNSARIFGLQILTNFIELCGDKLPLHPRLFSLISDPIFKCVLFMIQNVSKLSLLQAALQLFTTLVVILGNYLPMQVELTLTRIFSILSEDLPTGNSVNPNGSNTNLRYQQQASHVDTAVKELLTEQISILWTRSPSFFTSLFINYDCNLDRADLSLGFLKVLTKLALPESALVSTENVPPICLEGLVSLIDDMYAHMQLVSAEDYSKRDRDNPILKQRERKTEFINCAKAFNEKPKKGIPLLIEKHFIKSDTDKAIAEFLFENNSRMNKKTIGLLLCDPKQANLLNEFIGLFDFKGLRVDEAIRILLTKFRLPGESQQIERIVETFSTKYVESQEYPETPVISDEMKTVDEPNDGEKVESTEEEKNVADVQPDSDSVFVLSYSIIMLNTDLHNPQVKDHMTFEDYSGNLRGCYNSKDFPFWYLDKIYCSIRDKEIVMPEEHHGNERWFEDAWNNVIASTTVMTKSQKENVKITDNLTDIEVLDFDKAIFKHVGPSIVNTLFKIYVVASDDHITSRMLTSLDKCSSIAEFFTYKRLYNDILSTIGKITTLAGPNPYISQDENSSEFIDNIPLVEMLNDDSSKFVVSSLSVRLGKSFKGQLCTMIFFRILQRTKNPQIISTESWIEVIRIFRILYENLLISPDIFTDLQEKLKIGNLPKPQPEVSVAKHNENRGLFSTFASYLKGDEEPTEEEIEWSLKGIECIKNSKVTPSIFGNENIMGKPLIKTILDAINEKKTEENSRYFESELLFLVELIVALVLLCPDDKDLANVVLDKLFDLSKLSGVTKRTIRRLSTYELLLISVLDDQEERISAIISEHFLGRTDIFNQKYFETEQGKELIKRLLNLTDIANYGKYILKQEDYWKFLRSLASLPEHTNSIFAYVNKLVDTNNKNNKLLTDDDIFLYVLGLLDEISSIGAIGSRWEQEYNKSVTSGHKISNESPYQNIVETSLKSINLTSNLCDDKTLSRNKVVAIVQALSHQCMNPCEQVRSYALSCLEMTLTEKIELSNSNGIINIEDIISEGLMSIIDVKQDDQITNIPIQDILKIVGNVYIFHLKDGMTTNETFLKILNIFNKFVELPEVETQLQQLILEKKSIEKSNGLNVSSDDLAPSRDLKVASASAPSSAKDTENSEPNDSESKKEDGQVKQANEETSEVGENENPA